MKKLLFNSLLQYLGLVIIVCLVYAQGLNSRFILDDFHNLRGLSEISTVGYSPYVLSGGAGPTGRPVSYLSFALQHNAWPDNPFVFKVTNLLIHLINGLFVLMISFYLTKKLNLSDNQKIILCWLACSLWLLHPIQVTSVLYVVQRMTLISSLFILSGILSYLYFRKKYIDTIHIRYLFYVFIFVYISLVLATYSKEIGVLLPLYLIVIEFVLLDRSGTSKLWLNFSRLLLFTPVFIVCAYLLYSFDNINAGYQLRDFTMSQRLLTQASVLFDYIKISIIPWPGAFSLYNDDYPVSSDLFESFKTISAVIFILTVLMFSIYKRSKYIIFSFAFLWFFAGHALEGSILALELYYEHRNYLPSFGLFFLIVYFLICAHKKISNIQLGYFLIGLYFLTVFSVTYSLTSLWSKPYLQAVEWARVHPKSKRALTDALNFYVLTGETEKELDTLNSLKKLDEGDLYPHVRNIYTNYCLKNKKIKLSEWQEIQALARNAKYHGTSIIAEFDNIFFHVGKGKCRLQDMNEVYVILITLTGNPEFKSILGQLYEFATTASVLAGNYDRALKDITLAINHDSSIANKIYLVRILITLSRIDEAKIVLLDIKNKLSKLPKKRFKYKDMINHLEKDILQIN